ncbi:hypothetical protein B6D51_26570 [Pseudomonas chlororaphis subsp. chlororaphis]|nr:hypothetical protein B6D51_26570 [Pseudomonas chlororaphis subsp. chlororaphis]
MEYLEGNFSAEELASLLALYELGSSRGYYSERYDALYSDNLMEVQHNKREQMDYIISRGLIEDRSNFALRKMNQISILAELAITEPPANT